MIVPEDPERLLDPAAAGEHLEPLTARGAEAQLRVVVARERPAVRGEPTGGSAPGDVPSPPSDQMFCSGFTPGTERE